MNRLLNGAALAAGLAAAAWVAATHAGSHPAVLPMLGLIVAAFLAGALELRRYRHETQALLDAVTQAQAQPPVQAEAWLATLPETLRSAVRQRLKGERVALPGPALTPYLTGLLVLLGLLGTFIGMVATLGGTVAALGASTDLQAVRLALASPVQGLGLAFGTSVAGVAASAALGFMSTLARGDRTRASRTLDGALATALHPLTEDHRRALMLQALQASAEQGLLLPQVAQRMESALVQMAAAQRAAGDATVQALREAAIQGARETRALVEPLVEGGLKRLLEGIASHQGVLSERMQWMHTTWAASARETNEQMLKSAQEVHQGVTHAAQQMQQQLSEQSRALLAQLESQSRGLGAQLLAIQEESQAALHQEAGQSHAAWRAAADQTRLALGDTVERLHAVLAQAAQGLHARLEESTGQLHARLGEQTEHLRAAFLQQTGLAFGEFLQRYERKSLEWLERSAQEHAQRQSGLTTAATEAMAAWRGQVAQSLEREREQLAERERLLGAIDTLMKALQHAATEQRLALDGLLASAAEKLSVSAERFDSQASQVASTLMAATEQTTVSLNSATALAAGSLAEATAQAASSLAAATQQAAASSQTLAQVGQGFGQAVQEFGQVNQALGEQLARVEGALGQHLARSDEQLAYYVAQAREVIELTLSAQAQLLEDLRRVSRAAA